MQALVEITKYPFSRDYDKPILDFLHRMEQYEGLYMTVGETSTVIRGDYDELMEALVKEMKSSFEGEYRTAFVLKILNFE